ncbi:hypothetical protein OAJ57_02340 [Alphaproteobacteria bacterium]|nr:hypothetical protein [Alphaproteobacteria bacterium]
MHDPVSHAKAYPFPAPEHSYIYEAGEWQRLRSSVNTEDRTPVLAAGSNQSPEQLARKYGEKPDIGSIPAQRGFLHDFDVVYAAHLSGYGSVPATFQHSPGTIVTIFVLWLTGPQLVLMHATEGNYSYDHLEALRLELDGGTTLKSAYAYSSKIGCLSHEGNCVSLAEIAAEKRQYPALTQAEIQAVIRDRLAPGTVLDKFIEQHVTDRAIHGERSMQLAEGALSVIFRRRIIAEL